MPDIKEYETIKDLREAVESREIDETKLRIILDSDCTYFYLGDDEVTVKEAGGYGDIEPLYCLLFPDAEINWC